MGNGSWFHQLVDAADPGDSPHVAAAVLGAYGIVALVYAARQRDTPALEVDWPAAWR